MSKMKFWPLVTLVLITVLVVVACGAQPETQTIVETVIVTEKVVETVVVEGTPQIVEKEVEKVVEKVVVATPEAGEAKKVLRINPGNGTYPDIIDPQKSSFMGEIAHLRLMYEGLTNLNGDLETVPGAAESWEYNDDATELTFTLHDGLVYSDGSVLNALRFKYALMRNIDPETAGEYAAVTDEIVGAPEWRTGDDPEAGKALVEENIQTLDMDGNACVDYEQADCRVLKLTFSKPAPYFHTVMSMWPAFPAKEELIAEGGPNWWNSSKYHVGNGPYVLQNLEPFVRAYFTPNLNYWKGTAKTDIEYSYITDSAIRLQAYLNNELDIIQFGAEDYPTIQTDPQLSQEAQVFPGSCTFDVMFHQEKEPFTDKKVREAFTMAIDRDAWVQDILQGLGMPTLTWIPPGFPGYQDDETRWGFDPEAANQAIADSSYGSVENLPPVTLTFADNPRNRIRYEWLAANWKTVLGVDLELNPVEPTTYTALTKDRATAPQAYILGWCADYPDPQNWLSVYWKTGGMGERIAYSNPEVDALIDAADTSTNPEERMDLYYQAQSTVIGSLPGAFMWNNVNQFLVKPWVTGVEKTTPQDADWPGSYDAPLTIDIDMEQMEAAQ